MWKVSIEEMNLLYLIYMSHSKYFNINYIQIINKFSYEVRLNIIYILFDVSNIIIIIFTDEEEYLISSKIQHMCIINQLFRKYVLHNLLR